MTETRTLKRIQVNGQIQDIDVTDDATMVRPAGYGASGAASWSPTGEPLQIAPAAHIIDVDTNAAVDAAVDADTAVAAVSGLSAGAGADTIDRAALNTALTTLVSEANAIKTAYNALAGKYNSTAGKYNALAGKYNSLATKLNTLLAQNEAHGFNATS